MRGTKCASSWRQRCFTSTWKSARSARIGRIRRCISCGRRGLWWWRWRLSRLDQILETDLVFWQYFNHEKEKKQFSTTFLDPLDPNDSSFRWLVVKTAYVNSLSVAIDGLAFRWTNWRCVCLFGSQTFEHTLQDSSLLRSRIARNSYLWFMHVYWNTMPDVYQPFCFLWLRQWKSRSPKKNHPSYEAIFRNFSIIRAINADIF